MNRILVGIAACCVITMPQLAEAKPRPVDDSSEAVTAEQMRFPTPKASLGDVPVGGVIIWWGEKESLPEHFQLCNGDTAKTKDKKSFLYGKPVPNLVNRFAKGAREELNNVMGVAPGGSNSLPARATEQHVLTESEIPAHSHNVNDPGHQHPNTRDWLFTHGGGGTRVLDRMATRGSGGRPNERDDGYFLMDILPITGPSTTHVTIANAGGGLGHAHMIPTQDNRPEYVEVFYIIRYE